MEPRKNTLWFVTARTCNLACSYCYQGADNHEADYLRPRGLQSIMSKAVADKALPWALDWTPQEVALKVVFYGGEPTLAWPLIKAVVPEWEEAFKQAGKRVEFSLTTNGTMLDGESRVFMDKHDMGLLVSLDGPRESQDVSRPAKTGNGSSWDIIDPQGLLDWRPTLEVAWVLAPRGPWSREALDKMLHMGFRRVNFNLDFLQEWPLEEQARLQDFGQHVGRLCASGALLSNWVKKYDKAGTEDNKMERPCGTNVHGMLALTPEGDLFPSQEMAFTVYEDGRAPGTVDHYRVGNVNNTPVIDPVASARISILRTADMKPPAGFDCNDCVAKSACIGGCHCRYVGQDGVDPAQRMDIPVGNCQSLRAMMSGMMQGYWVERKLRPETYYHREVKVEKGCGVEMPLPSHRPPAPLPLTQDPFESVSTIGGSNGV